MPSDDQPTLKSLKLELHGTRFLVASSWHSPDDTREETGPVEFKLPSVNKEYLSQIQFYSTVDSIFSELPVLSNTVIIIISVCVKVANSTFLVTKKRTKWALLSRYYLTAVCSGPPTVLFIHCRLAGPHRGTQSSFLPACIPTQWLWKIVKREEA